jgi:branched-chain amino acid transport system permease protein
VNATFELIIKTTVGGFSLGGAYLLMSIGLTLIAGVLRVVNFAHGSLTMMAMYIVFWLFTLYHIDPFLSLIITIPLLFLIGMGMQKILISPLKNIDNQVLVTFGFAILLDNLALFFWSADYRVISRPFSEIFLHTPYGNLSLVRILLIIVGLVSALGLHIFITHTRVGKAIWALAQDPETTMLMGINIHRLRLLTFGIGVALAGVSGTFFAQSFYIYPTFGSRFIIIAFIIVVLGGFGSIGGAVLGSFVISFTEVFSTFFFGAGYSEMLIYSAFVAVLIFRPSGLLAK